MFSLSTQSRPQSSQTVLSTKTDTYLNLQAVKNPYSQCEESQSWRDTTISTFENNLINKYLSKQKSQDMRKDLSDRDSSFKSQSLKQAEFNLQPSYFSVQRKESNHSDKLLNKTADVPQQNQFLQNNINISSSRSEHQQPYSPRVNTYYNYDNQPNSVNDNMISQYASSPPPSKNVYQELQKTQPYKSPQTFREHNLSSNSDTHVYSSTKPYASYKQVSQPQQHNYLQYNSVQPNSARLSYQKDNLSQLPSSYSLRQDNFQSISNPSTAVSQNGTNTQLEFDPHSLKSKKSSPEFGDDDQHHGQSEHQTSAYVTVNDPRNDSHPRLLNLLQNISINQGDDKNEFHLLSQSADNICKSDNPSTEQVLIQQMNVSKPKGGKMTKILEAIPEYEYSPIGKLSQIYHQDNTRFSSDLLLSSQDFGAQTRSNKFDQYEEYQGAKLSYPFINNHNLDKSTMQSQQPQQQLQQPQLQQPQQLNNDQEQLKISQRNSSDNDRFQSYRAQKSNNLQKQQPYSQKSEESNFLATSQQLLNNFNVNKPKTQVPLRPTFQSINSKENQARREQKGDNYEPKFATQINPLGEQDTNKQQICFDSQNNFDSKPLSRQFYSPKNKNLQEQQQVPFSDYFSQPHPQSEIPAPRDKFPLKQFAHTERFDTQKIKKAQPLSPQSQVFNTQRVSFIPNNISPIRSPYQENDKEKYQSNQIRYVSPGILSKKDELTKENTPSTNVIEARIYQVRESVSQFQADKADDQSDNQSRVSFSSKIKRKIFDGQNEKSQPHLSAPTVKINFIKKVQPEEEPQSFSVNNLKSQNYMNKTSQLSQNTTYHHHQDSLNACPPSAKDTNIQIKNLIQNIKSDEALIKPELRGKSPVKFNLFPQMLQMRSPSRTSNGRNQQNEMNSSKRSISSTRQAQPFTTRKIENMNVVCTDCDQLLDSKEIETHQCNQNIKKVLSEKPEIPLISFPIDKEGQINQKLEQVLIKLNELPMSEERDKACSFISKVLKNDISAVDLLQEDRKLIGLSKSLEVQNNGTPLQLVQLVQRADNLVRDKIEARLSQVSNHPSITNDSRLGSNFHRQVPSEISSPKSTSTANDRIFKKPIGVVRSPRTNDTQVRSNRQQFFSPPPSRDCDERSIASKLSDNIFYTQQSPNQCYQQNTLLSPDTSRSNKIFGRHKQLNTYISPSKNSAMSPSDFLSPPKMQSVMTSQTDINLPHTQNNSVSHFQSIDEKNSDKRYFYSQALSEKAKLSIDHPSRGYKINEMYFAAQCQQIREQDYLKFIQKFLNEPIQQQQQN